MKKAFIFVLFLLSTLAAASAQDSAKEGLHHIDFTQPMVDLDGKPMVQSEKSSLPITLGDVVEGALNYGQTDSGQAAEIYSLMLKIHRQRSLVLVASEITLIEAKLNKSPYSPLVIGEALRLIEPAAAK